MFSFKLQWRRQRKMIVLSLLFCIWSAVATLKWHVFLSYGSNSSLNYSQVVLLSFVGLHRVIGLSSAKDLPTCIVSPIGLSVHFSDLLKWDLHQNSNVLLSRVYWKNKILEVEPIPKLVEGNRITLTDFSRV